MFDDELKSKLENYSLYNLICMGASNYITTIDNIYEALLELYDNNMIEDNYTIDDIKYIINDSRYVSYDEITKIITNSLVDNPVVDFSIEAYIETIKL
jgi:hypothetical protein